MKKLLYIGVPFRSHLFNALEILEVMAGDEDFYIEVLLPLDFQYELPTSKLHVLSYTSPIKNYDYSKIVKDSYYADLMEDSYSQIAFLEDNNIKIDFLVFDSLSYAGIILSEVPEIRSIRLHTTHSIPPDASILSTSGFYNIAIFAKYNVFLNKIEKLIQRELAFLHNSPIFTFYGTNIVLLEREIQVLSSLFKDNYYFVGYYIRNQIKSLQREAENTESNLILSLGSMKNVELLDIDSLVNLLASIDFIDKIFIERNLKSRINIETPRIRYYSFEDYPMYLAKSEIVVCLGGVNSLAESTFLRKKTIAIALTDEHRINIEFFAANYNILFLDLNFKGNNRDRLNIFEKTTPDSLGQADLTCFSDSISVATSVKELFHDIELARHHTYLTVKGG